MKRKAENLLMLFAEGCNPTRSMQLQQTCHASADGLQTEELGPDLRPGQPQNLRSIVGRHSAPCLLRMAEEELVDGVDVHRTDRCWGW